MIAAKYNEAARNGSDGVHAMDNRVRAVITLMKSNLHQQLSANDMAQSVHLSSSRLSHLFKAETGTSLVRYQKKLRMEQARVLLRTTFLSVKEVAAGVGISDISHFVRDFERTFRLTPARHAARYRKIHESTKRPRVTMTKSASKQPPRPTVISFK